jgi:carboxypeptidase Taq
VTRREEPARAAAGKPALLARMVHQQFTAPRIDELLNLVAGSELVRDPGSDAAVNVREIRRDYDRAGKLPPKLVEEMTRTAVLSERAWIESRQKSDYTLFKPWLQKTVELQRRKAECLGHDGEPYDPLLDGYEPEEKTANLRQVFESLRAPLVELVQRVVHSGRVVPIEILHRKYPPEAQATLAREAAERIGFDFRAGRLDVTVHPFCSGIGPGDTRLTTRYDPEYFTDAFSGVVHEAGHGMYDQGLPAQHWGTPLGDTGSLGIHESQSRLWQIMVGQSRGFWRFFFPRAKELFSEALHDVDFDQWYAAINHVRPSLIRTESDAATYNLHILLRFEMELALIGGELEAADVPAAWNEKMRHYLGIEPPDDARGCLQDIHWSDGAFGYFPTYTLGNLYAAQFMERARDDLGDLEEQFARGEFAPLLAWLREHIHRHGRRYPAAQLVQRITGAPLSPQPLLRFLTQQAREVYGV